MQIIYARDFRSGKYYLAEHSHVGAQLGIVWSTWAVKHSTKAIVYCGLLFGPAHWLYDRIPPLRLMHAIGASKHTGTVRLWHVFPSTYARLHSPLWGVCGIPVHGIPKSLPAYCENLCSIVNAYQADRHAIRPVMNNQT